MTETRDFRTCETATGGKTHALTDCCDTRTLCGTAIKYRLTATSEWGTPAEVAAEVDCPNCAERLAWVAARRAAR